MSRLTIEQLENYRNTYDKFDGIDVNEFEEICNELIKYRQLEDKLGCPLEVITSKTAMVVKNDSILEMNIMAIGFNDGTIHFGSSWSFTTRKLKDYKKTWWMKGDLSE